MFDIPSFTVDGMDLCAVQAASLREVVRTGVDPTFLLCNTYRLGGHHTGDKQEYKDVGEAFTWRAKDPIVQLRI